MNRLVDVESYLFKDPGVVRSFDGDLPRLSVLRDLSVLCYLSVLHCRDTGGCLL